MFWGWAKNRGNNLLRKNNRRSRREPSMPVAKCPPNNQSLAPVGGKGAWTSPTLPVAHSTTALQLQPSHEPFYIKYKWKGLKVTYPVMCKAWWRRLCHPPERDPISHPPPFLSADSHHWGSGIDKKRDQASLCLKLGSVKWLYWWGSNLPAHIPAISVLPISCFVADDFAHLQDNMCSEVEKHLYFTVELYQTIQG